MVHYQGQVGLLDLALDPQFAANRRIFFTYSEPNGDINDIVVATAKLAADDSAITGSTVIFRAAAMSGARRQPGRTHRHRPRWQSLCHRRRSLRLAAAG